MKQKMKQLIGILLSIALMLGMLPVMSLTAYADGTTYNPASTYTGFGDLITNDTDVTISEVSGKTWYVIANDNSTVTLLSKDSFGNKALYTADGLSVTKKKGAGEYWWLCSPGAYALDAAYVIGGSGDVDVYGFPVDTEIGVRPALKLNLSSVIFSSESNAFSLPVPVTGVTLNPSTAQTITVGDKVPFTASIEPAGAEKEFSLTVKAGEEPGPEPGPKPEPGPGPEPSAEIQTDSTLPEAKPDEEFDSCIIKIY